MMPDDSGNVPVSTGPVDPWRGKLTRFLGVGVLNTLFGYLVYALLIIVQAPPLLALLLATIFGIIFNYFSIGRLVFRNQSKWTTFVRFICAYAIVYTINATLLKGLIQYCLLSPFVAQILCIPPSVLISWLLMNYWVYKNA